MSSTFSARVMAIAKRTALTAQTAALKQKQKVKLEEIKHKQRWREFELRTMLEMAKAN